MVLTKTIMVFACNTRLEVWRKTSSWHGRPFGHNRHGPKTGGGGAGSPSNTMWPGPTPTYLRSGILIHPAVWPQQTWAKNWGEGLCPFREGVLGPYLSFILIHPTVWPQYTNVTDRQTDRTGQTDNDPTGRGGPFYKRLPKKLSGQLTTPDWPGKWLVQGRIQDLRRGFITVWVKKVPGTKPQKEV